MFIYAFLAAIAIISVLLIAAYFVGPIYTHHKWLQTLDKEPRHSRDISHLFDLSDVVSPIEQSSYTSLSNLMKLKQKRITYTTRNREINFIFLDYVLQTRK